MADIIGTPGNDFLFFQGQVEQLTLTLVNPYSSASVDIDDEFNVNTASYEGLSGFDVLNMTNIGDALFVEDSVGNQLVANIEFFRAGNGGDIVALASNNIILGDTIIDGGNADDVLWANAGNDVVNGGGGNDIIDGGPGNDDLRGGEGNDEITGGTGNDILSGGMGDDSYVYASGDGADIITETGGNDTLLFSAGITLASLDFSESGSDLVIDTDGTGLNTITITDHFLTADAQVETIEFSDGSTFDLAGLTINHDPIAQDDNFGGVEDQAMSGNVLSDNGNGVDSDIDGDPLMVQAGMFATTAGGTVTLLADGSFTYVPAEEFTGLDSFEYTLLDGQGGSDIGMVSLNIDPEPINTITGTPDDDSLFGNNGDDLIQALEGDDLLSGGNGDDQLFGDAGNDFLDGGNGDDFLDGGTGADLLEGGKGDDILQFGVDAEVPAGWWAWNVGSDGIEGTDRWVSIRGMNQSSDTFNGGKGFDTLEMTDGDDAFFLWNPYSENHDLGTDIRISGVEQINAGAGNDVIDFTHNEFSYGDLIINGEEGNDYLWSSVGNDVINGGDGNDDIYGGGGEDILNGDAGDDTIYGSNENDFLNGGTGNDILYGGSEAAHSNYGHSDYGYDDYGHSDYGYDDYAFGDYGQNLYDSEINDVLIGGAGDDVLFGEGGNDVLIGGEGADLLYGGSGADQFIFDVMDGAVDTIYNFETGSSNPQKLFTFSADTPPGSDNGGDIEHVETSFNETTNEFTFELVVSDPHSRMTEGFTVAINDGPNPKSHGGEMALFYFDASGDEPIVSAYGYNGENDFSSAFDGSSASGTQTPDRIVTSLATDNPFTEISSSINAEGQHVFTFSMDASVIVEHDPLFGSGEDWTGVSFDDQMGMWLHPMADLETSYDDNGFLSQWDYGAQGWFDNTNAPTAMTLVDGGGLEAIDVLNLTDILEGFDPLSSVISDFIQLNDTASGTEILVNADGDVGGAFAAIAIVESGLENTGLADLLTAGSLVVDQSFIV